MIYRHNIITGLNDEDGFTLLEMMVVIMIIGLLAGLIVPNLLGSKDKADQKKAIADIVALENAIELYRMDNDKYPDNREGMGVLLRSTDTDAESIHSGGYIKRLPEDPWHHPYRYVVPGKKGDFDVFTYGSDNRPGGEGINKDIGTWNLSEFK